MKKLILISVVTFILLIGNSNTFFAQDVTVFTTSSKIVFNAQSDEREITVGVSDVNTIMTMNIASTISSGVLTIEIYDPTGEKQGNFNLGYQIKSTKNEIKSIQSNSDNKSSEENLVRGNINKSIKNPTTGNWIIKMIPKNVTGEIKINVHQSSSMK